MARPVGQRTLDAGGGVLQVGNGAGEEEGSRVVEMNGDGDAEGRVNGGERVLVFDHFVPNGRGSEGKGDVEMG